MEAAGDLVVNAALGHAGEGSLGDVQQTFGAAWIGSVRAASRWRWRAEISETGQSRRVFRQTA